METAEKKVFGLNRNVLFLGVVSFLTDISSEMIFTLLPLFLLNVVKAGTPVIGLVEGVGEGTASLVRLGSGWLSDRLGRRKNLAVIGYGLSTLAKPLLLMAGSWGAVLGIRFGDRLGKGIRSAPRDALIADSTSPTEMGRSFGFHRGMDTLGALIGLLLAAWIVFLSQRGGLELSRGSFQTLVLVGIGPAALAVLVLILFVREKKRVVSRLTASPAAVNVETGPVSSSRPFDTRFKLFLLILALFTLGNSSDAFLVLRAQNVGMPVVQILLLLALFNAVYATAAFPAGFLSDRIGRKGLLIFGWSIYSLTYLGFAFAASGWQVWLLFGVYGLYTGVFEGVSRAFVADLVPIDRRGTAFGLYNGVIGLSLLGASIIAGWLWFLISPGATFIFGSAMAGAAMLALALFIREGGRKEVAAR